MHKFLLFSCDHRLLMVERTIMSIHIEASRPLFTNGNQKTYSVSLLYNPSDARIEVLNERIDGVELKQGVGSCPREYMLVQLYSQIINTFSPDYMSERHVSHKEAFIDIDCANSSKKKPVGFVAGFGKRQLISESSAKDFFEGHWYVSQMLALRVLSKPKEAFSAMGHFRVWNIKS